MYVNGAILPGWSPRQMACIRAVLPGTLEGHDDAGRLRLEDGLEVQKRRAGCGKGVICVDAQPAG